MMIYAKHQKCVSGDITLGQCKKAVSLANQYLNEPIGMPVRCELDQLYRRIRELPLYGAELLNIFQNLYLGPLNKEYGTFVKEHFSQEERMDFWVTEFSTCKVGTRGFSSTLKQFFNLGNDLETLCEILKSDTQVEEKDYECIIQEIMRTNLFLENKDLRDCLEIEKEAESPYTIYTLMAQFLFSGAANPSVDAYLPGEKIQEILCRHFGGSCDVPKIMNEYLERMATEKKENPSAILNNYMDSVKGSMEQEMEAYDICDMQELIYFESGDRIKPSLEEQCLKYIDFYKDVCKEDDFDELMKQSPKEKCVFLMEQNRYLFLMKERWMEMIDLSPDKNSH